MIRRTLLRVWYGCRRPDTGGERTALCLAASKNIPNLCLALHDPPDPTSRSPFVKLKETARSHVEPGGSSYFRSIYRFDTSWYAARTL